jgi:FKBP-type peptidyl-prolyl cis-trans isomerase
MKFWRMAIGGSLVGLGLCGCEEPSGIMPVTPPGAIIPRESTDPDPAQALGESAPAVNSGGATATTTPASTPAKESDIKPAPATAKGETKTTPGGVKYETLKEGTGPELQVGQRAKMHYEGKLENGEVFDASRPRGAPFDVTIGTKQVIRGWDEAIPGMKVGEVRKLTIPAALGYGATGSGSKIPPNSTLIFEVELVAIQ